MNKSVVIRVLLVVIALLLGLVAAQLGGFLAFVGGSSVTSAVAAAGVAFAGTVTIALAIEKALGWL